MDRVLLYRKDLASFSYTRDLESIVVYKML